MTKRFLVVLTAAAALLAVDAARPTSRASAQEVQITGPLAGQPAVRRMRLYRKGRFLLEPNFSFTLQDPFVRTLYAGAHLGFYFTDWLGVGVWGAYGVAGINTGLTRQIEQNGVTTDRNRLSFPTRENFREQVARMTFVAALQLEFIPLRGKLALFQKLFVDTDFHIFVGAAAVGLTERADVALVGSGSAVSNQCAIDNLDCLARSQTDRQNRVAIAPTFGAGLTMMFNNFIGLSFDWRGMPFAVNNSGTDESGSNAGDFPDGSIDSQDRFFRFNQMIQLGIVIYLPPQPTITE
ncbi:MAG: hypothetical protein KF901_16635 [Myxococcales bacterium]|nr:hypothetical protein [Myxococcales bacterium]